MIGLSIVIFSKLLDKQPFKGHKTAQVELLLPELTVPLYTASHPNPEAAKQTLIITLLPPRSCIDETGRMFLSGSAVLAWVAHLSKAQDYQDAFCVVNEKGVMFDEFQLGTLPLVPLTYFE